MQVRTLAVRTGLDTVLHATPKTPSKVLFYTMIYKLKIYSTNKLITYTLISYAKIIVSKSYCSPQPGISML